MHVALLAAGDSVGPTHVVREVAIGSDPPHEVRAQVAMQDAGPILGPQDERGAHGDRLLPGPVIERSWHLALLVEGQRALLGSAHHGHVSKEGRAILPRQGRIGELAYALTRDDARVRSLHIPSAFRSGPATGSPSAGPLSPLTGSPIAAPTDQGARVPPHDP